MTLWNTTRMAVRTWRRTPGLAAVVVATLALGLGATTTAFSIAHSILIEPLPFPAADRLVWITTYDTRHTNGAAAAIDSNRLPQLADWQRGLDSFEQMGAWAGRAPDVFTIVGSGTPERVSGLRVTHGLLPLLGARPAAGRLFANGDDAPGAVQTVLLSHGFWQRRFAGRPDVIGQSVSVESTPHTIVGVVAPDFPLSASLFAGAPIDVYLPLEVDGDSDIGGFISVVGRLRPGVTAAQARAEVAARHATLSVGRWAWMSVLGQQVTALPDLVTADAREPLLLLLAGVGCALLIACTNVANLLLMRASGRRREMQVRAALGASMRQLMGQTTIESALLVGIGGLTGVILAAAITRVLARASWLSLARHGELHIGWESVALVAGICAVVTFAFGGVALFHLRRGATVDGLRQHPGVTPDRRTALVQRMALGLQVTVVVVLTGVSGLLVRSLVALLEVDPGFNPRGAMAIRVDPAGRLAPLLRLQFFDRVLERVRSLPGVQSAALTIHVPMGDRPSMGWDAIPEGRHYNPVTDSVAGRIVSPDYYRAAGVRVVAGRDFDSRDVRPASAVMAVNETFARQIRATGGDPLQSRFLVLGEVRQVVAVVADVRHRSLDGDAGREVYIPMAQAPAFFGAYDLVVRAADPLALAPAIRSAIWDLDRDQALGTPTRLGDYVGRTLSQRRLLSTVIGVFAVSTLFLAAFGVYGVVGYRVSQRTKEIAIRAALGAPRWRITAAALGDTAASVCLGILSGLLVTLWAADAVRNQLFGVQPDDVPTLAAACAVVVVSALAAGYGPARRAARVDPIKALRVD